MALTPSIKTPSGPYDDLKLVFAEDLESESTPKVSIPDPYASFVSQFYNDKLNHLYKLSNGIDLRQVFGNMPNRVNEYAGMGNVIDAVGSANNEDPFYKLLMLLGGQYGQEEK